MPKIFYSLDSVKIKEDGILSEGKDVNAIVDKMESGGESKYHLGIQESVTEESLKHGLEEQVDRLQEEAAMSGALISEISTETAGQSEMQKVFEELGVKEISIHKGDNLWNIIGKKFDELNWGNDYKELAKGQKTYAIDFIKDKIAVMSPEELKEIGIKSGDINKLNIGDKIDLSKIINEENVSNAVERVQGLTLEQISDIKKGQRIIPKEILTPIESKTSEIDKKVFDVFDKQDRLEKWRQIQILKDWRNRRNK